MSHEIDRYCGHKYKARKARSHSLYERKIIKLLRILINPKTRTLEVSHHAETVILKNSDILTLPGLLPSFEVVSCGAFNLYKWNRHLACSTTVHNIIIIQFSCVTA
jgi:hypothetical protein